MNRWTRETKAPVTSELDVTFAIPPPLQRARELLVTREPARLALQASRLATTPRGAGRPLLAIPGFGATDTSMLPIRRYLATRSHDTHGWGLGRNNGQVEALLDETIPVAARLADLAEQPINLLGWSLGGVIAREVARDRPDLVNRIATYGTPLTGPRFTAAAGAYTSRQLDDVDALIRERQQRPIRRPILAVYSHNDGVVDWRTCIDREHPRVTHRRSTSTHIGMGIDPDVWRWTAEWFAALPVLDSRSEDELLGYDEIGVPT